jgi:hypothetical protein
VTCSHHLLTRVLSPPPQVVEHSQAPEIPQELPLQLRDLLSACFRHKAEQRPTPVQLLRLLETVPIPKQDPPEARPRRPLTPVITEEEDRGLAAGSSAALRRSSTAAAATAAAAPGATAAAGPMPAPPPATSRRHAMARHLDTGADFAPVPRPLLKLPSMPPTAPAAAAGDQSTPQPAGAEIQADAALKVSSSTKRQRSSAAGAAGAGAAAAAGTNAASKGPAPSDSPAKNVMRLPRLTSAPAGARSKAKQQEEEPALVPVAPLSAALKRKQAQLQAMRASQALQQQAALQAQQEKQRQAEEQAKKQLAEQQAKQAKQQQAKEAEKQEQAEQQTSAEAEADHAEAQEAAFAAAEAGHTISEVASSSTGKVQSPKGGAATRMPRMIRGTTSGTPQQQQAGLPPPPAFLQAQGKQGEPATNAASGPLKSLRLSQVAESDRLSAGPESPHTMPPRAAGPGIGAQQQAGDADTDMLMGAGDSLQVPPMTAGSSSPLLPEASDESLSSTRAVASNGEADPSLRAAAKCVTLAADLVEQGELDKAEVQLR